MKKRIVMIFLSSLMLLLSSCGEMHPNEEPPLGETNTDEESSYEETTVKETEPTVNDIVFQTEPLESSLTTEYDLEELKAFFEGHSHADSFLGISKPTLSFSQVNERFPIEITRSSNYSVYRVKQGGFFYVFWVHCYPDYPNIGWQASPELVVEFCTYLASEKSLDLSEFESLVCEKSTAEDVKKIDPYFHLSFLLSSGIYSYSYLDEENVLEIEYFLHENICGYQDLIIKEMTVISRKFSPRYGRIWSEDIP